MTNFRTGYFDAGRGPETGIPLDNTPSYAFFETLIAIRCTVNKQINKIFCRHYHKGCHSCHELSYPNKASY